MSVLRMPDAVATVQGPQAFREGRLYRLGDAAIAFVPSAQKLMVLNPTAGYIWTRVAAGVSPDSCVDELRELMAVPPPAAREYVDAFLDGVSRALEAEEPEFDLHVLPAQPARRGDVAASACYRLGSAVVRISCTSQREHEAIAGMLSHLATGDRPADHTVDVVSEADGLRLILDSATGITCESPRELLPGLVTLLFSVWYRSSVDFVAFHAGLVAFQGRTVLIPGNSGSGKTTTTAALLSVGAAYMSDDVVALERETLAATGFPVPLAVKAEHVSRIAAFFPDLADQSEHVRMDGTRLRYLTPGRIGHGRRIDAIVFPRYRQDSETAVETVPPAEALQRLASEWVRVATISDEDVERLVDWIGSTPSVQITYGSPDALRQALDGFLETR
ncbi:PqqD family peptide modification chaperone [Ferruginivarius sediminum]|uniref:PqqD family peptide modification chaperone n=1 Tax=Ferruginivarius sediminum TaxID=2661937 RepID=A0A369TAZ5_9PROT|nr:PqqD family peptide modification chaperone [Ferruginivarius sediminum]RDD62501.1 hypothetical protein DRB17_07605 [Ferruginivarius sediminum]